MRRFALAFDDAALERSFRDDYARRRLPYLRMLFVFGPLLYATFGVLDAYVAPDVQAVFGVIRYALVCPVLLLVLLVSFVAPRWFVRHHQPLVAGMVVLGGLGIVAMTAIARPPTSHYYYAGLMLVITVGFTLTSLRFTAATLAAWLIVLAYELSATLIEGAPWKVVFSNNFFLISSSLVGMLACYTMERLERRSFLDMRATMSDRAQLAELNQQLREITLREPLTGLLSRRYLDERLDELVATCRRYRTPASVMIIDLDGFKEVNDRHGHLVGDELLRQVANLLRSNVRDTDLVYRYGGDEFCVLLPNTELSTTHSIGERLIGALRTLSLPGATAPAGISLSAGALAVDGAAGSATELLARTDALLYQAKREGRGRIVVADPKCAPPSPPAPGRDRRSR